MPYRYYEPKGLDELSPTSGVSLAARAPPTHHGEEGLLILGPAVQNHLLPPLLDLGHPACGTLTRDTGEVALHPASRPRAISGQSRLVRVSFGQSGP